MTSPDIEFLFGYFVGIIVGIYSFIRILSIYYEACGEKFEPFKIFRRKK